MNAFVCIEQKRRFFKELVTQAQLEYPNFATMYKRPVYPLSKAAHVVIIEVLTWLKDELKHLIRHHKDHIANCKMVGYMSGLSIHNQQLLKCENQMREYNKLICQARHSKRVLVKIGGLNE